MLLPTPRPVPMSLAALGGVFSVIRKSISIVPFTTDMPTLTFALKLSGDVTSSDCKSGKHGAISLGFSRNPQTTSRDAGVTKEPSRCINHHFSRELSAVQVTHCMVKSFLDQK